MPKQGFKNQWIEICRVGDFIDASGQRVKVTQEILDEMIESFDLAEHEPPIVIGHPKLNAPAFGWTRALKRDGDVLLAQFADTDDQFEQMVEDGKFRKRSVSFYQNPAKLRHVGFLGAMPPAIKGLRDIQFSDGDETVTVEISFNEEQQMSKENETTPEDKKKFTEWLKELLGGGQSTTPTTANLSEAGIQSMINTAVAKAKDEAKTEAVAEFSEQLQQRDKQIETLTASVNAQSTSGRRAEIVNFVESIPAEKGRHFLKRAGIVNFLEACADVDAASENAIISFSEGEGDDKVEHEFTMLDWAKNLISALPSMVQFGEKFGTITATDEVQETMEKNPARVNSMKERMGIPAEGGAK